MFRKTFPTQICHFYTCLIKLKNNHYFELFNLLKMEKISFNSIISEKYKLYVKMLRITNAIHLWCFQTHLSKLNLKYFQNCPEWPPRSISGLIPLQLHICHMNLKNYRTCLGFFRSALTCSCIHIVHCIDDMCWLFPFRCLPLIDRKWLRSEDRQRLLTNTCS